MGTPPPTAAAGLPRDSGYGDETASSHCIDWAAALVEHGRWLRTIAAARLGQSEGIDEVMQEVALAAVKQSAPISDPTKVAPWLYRLVVRQCLLLRRSYGRRRKLIARYTERYNPTEYDDEQSDPLRWLLADERQRLIRRGLQELQRVDREILLLKYTESWDYHRIAAHLGISHSAVEARLHRARQRLREILTRSTVIEPTSTVV